MNHDFKDARLGVRSSLVGLSLTAVLAFAPTAHAATLCVDQHGKPGCSSTISAAVAAASPGDTVQVDAGTYYEDVVIDKSLSLLGSNRDNTIINAIGLTNGIYIDGFDNSGLTDVVVTGFTVENANFEGILVNDADAITIWGNIVRENDKWLEPSSAVCPNMPAFETSEGNDCGEGIHLIGATHTIVSDNLVEMNAGGILISDETNSSHDNIVERNLVENNAYACGITLASHPAYVNPSTPQTGTPVLAFGVYNNNIFQNDSIHNGFGGGGAGVGVFAPGSGNRAYANSITSNRLIGNSLPGVAIHNHASIVVSASKSSGGGGGSNNPDVSRNAIVGNYIAGNGPDPDAPTTVPTGIAIHGDVAVVDTVITNNFIEDESIDVAFNSPSTLEIHLNDLSGHHVGIANLNAVGVVNARENWWGCPGGPGAWGCATVTGTAVTYTPWLTRPMDGTLGHGFDRFFDFFHDYDFDCIRDYDFSHQLY